MQLFGNKKHLDTQEKDWIEGAKHGDSKSQKAIFDMLSSKMYAICLRYMGDKDLAEDILQDGFVTLFSKLDSYSGVGSFEGWARRVFVNTALMSLRKKDAMKNTEDVSVARNIASDDPTVIQKISYMDLLKLITELPTGFRTVFNILGPLTNPGSPTRQLLGVYDEYLVQPLTQVLISLGVQRGMVVYGQDKLDEISLSAPTTVCEFRDGWYKTYTISPEDFGLQRCAKSDLTGGTPQENAQITREILSGAKGPRRDAVLLNAGAALTIGGKAESMKEGVALAAELIDSGKAMQTLQALIEVSNRAEA